ncbi:MAG: glycosyltransferase family 2 protein [Phycisphaerales bacterium]|nr:glycosyltransferase family 2 protein [Phycisphaerales bacterium]
MASNADCPSISVIVPVYEEEDNVMPLMERLFAVLDAMKNPSDVIAVDDGSKDQTARRLQDAAKQYPRLRVVRFRRNHGQTAAMQAGIDFATGEVIVPIDADLQNDPEDIPRLLEKLAEGYDVVSGWRKNRQDAPIRRNFLSRQANRVISRVSGVHLHDYGCSLKAYRRDVLENVRLYGEMHRFIPIYASFAGARVTEIPVAHAPRTQGKSKYGMERTLKVMLDLMVVRFLDKYLVKPIYVFGGFGFLCFLAALGFFTWMLVLKLGFDTNFNRTPLPVLTATTFLMGMMSILLGLVAEIVARIYFESTGRRSYTVAEILNPPPRQADRRASVNPGRNIERWPEEQTHPEHASQ